MLDVRILGEVPYEEAQALMKELQHQRIEGTIPDTLLILSHPEVVTVGPRARNDGVRPPSDYTTVAVDRGGGLTWHGPGQVVGYPIVKWGEREGEGSVADIIHIIEGWLIEALATFGVKGERDDRMQGVWVDGRKVCSIGLSFLRWVSRHGFSVNLNTPAGPSGRRGRVWTGRRHHDIARTTWLRCQFGFIHRCPCPRCPGHAHSLRAKAVGSTKSPTCPSHWPPAARPP